MGSRVRAKRRQQPAAACRQAAGGVPAAAGSLPAGVHPKGAVNDIGSRPTSVQNCAEVLKVRRRVFETFAEPLFWKGFGGEGAFSDAT